MKTSPLWKRDTGTKKEGFFFFFQIRDVRAKKELERQSNHFILRHRKSILLHFSPIITSYNYTMYLIGKILKIVMPSSGSIPYV